MTELEKIIELFKREDKTTIMYFDTTRLFFDGQWLVRGGQNKNDAILYVGDSLMDALLVLEAERAYGTFSRPQYSG